MISKDGLIDTTDTAFSKTAKTDGMNTSAYSHTGFNEKESTILN